MSGRRIGRLFSPALVSLALVLGACGSDASDTPAAPDTSAPPAALALDDADETGAQTTTDDVSASDVGSTDTVFDIAEFASLADLESVELTPELFEQLKANDASRAAIIVEMQNQGLDAAQSECFLDQVSPGLFIAFGTGQQPDDAQFGELLSLLDTCEIAFGG